MTFAQPFWLLLLLLLPALYWQYRRVARQRHVVLQVSRLEAMRSRKTWMVYARSGLQWMRWAAIGLMAVAMARPQRLWHEEKIEAEAIDILLAMDVSPSMLSKDFSPDRLTVAKQIAADFANKRRYDRMGLVAFSGGAFTQCPLTTDRRILQSFIHNLSVGRLPDGTAIGMGIATAVDRLKDSPSKSRVVILMTDGENNAGGMGPLKAAAVAKALGVRVYTVGIGKDGTVLSPSRQYPNGTYAFSPRQMYFDSRLLEETAAITGGRFFRAQSAADLTGIYSEIDKLEKAKITINALRRTAELYYTVLNFAFCLIILELLLRWGPLRVITV